MALIEWKDEFKTGVASVDHEHAELIALLNDLHANLNAAAGSNQETVSAFLGEVYAKIAAHFALEESTMRARNYDQFADHKADHEALLDDIRDIMDDFDRNAYFDYEEALAEHLRDWFTNHFQTKDARLHKLLG